MKGLIGMGKISVKNGRATFYIDSKQYDLRARKNESDVQLAARAGARKKEIEDSRIILDKNTTVEFFARQYIKTYKENSVSTSWYKDLERNLEKHIIPYIGRMKLKDVKQLHLQQILNNLSGHSKSHIKKVKQLVFSIFEIAEIEDLVMKNPAKGLILPKATDGTGRAITEFERTLALRVASYHRAGMWIKTMLYTGMRPGETATLQVKNIDLKNRIIKIETARESRTNVVKEPKSRAGIRIVPILDIFYDDLYEYCKGKNPFDYLFTQPTTGKRHTQTSMAQMWKSFKYHMNVEAGCKTKHRGLIPPLLVADDLVPYYFRHTFATDLSIAGVPIVDIKEIMGHAELDTTLIYAHPSLESFNSAKTIMNTYIKNTR